MNSDLFITSRYMLKALQAFNWKQISQRNCAIKKSFGGLNLSGMVLIIFLAPFSAFAGLLDWWSFDSSSDFVDTERVRIEENLGTLDGGSFGSIPVWIQYEPSRIAQNSLFGDGWYCPFLESHALWLDETHLKVWLPNGKSLIFERPSPTGALESIDGWNVELAGNQLILRNLEGQEIFFSSGKLDCLVYKEIKIVIGRSKDRVQSVSINGKQVMALSYKKGGEIYEVLFNEKLIKIFVNRVPNIQKIADVSVVVSVVPVLESIVWQNGFWKNFQKSTTEKSESSIIISSGGSTFGENTVEIIPVAAPAVANNDKTDFRNYFTSGLLAGRLRSDRRQGEHGQEILTRISYDESGSILRGVVGENKLLRDPNLIVMRPDGTSFEYVVEDNVFFVKENKKQ